MAHVEITPKHEYRFDTYIANLRADDANARKEELDKAMKDISPRSLYEAKGLTAGWQIEVPLGLVRFALRKITVNPMLDLRLAAVNMLVDGWVLFYQRVDESFIIEDPHRVKSIAWGDRDVAEEVVIEYETDKVDPITKKPIWRREHYYWEIVVSDDAGALTRGEPVVAVVEYVEGAREEDIAKAVKVEKLPFWPYRAVRWVDRESILEQAKIAILRYEAVLDNIAMDNNKHARRVKTYENVSSVNVSPGAVQDGQGFEKLPKDSKAYYVNTHPEGLVPMFKELETLEERIRQTTGYTKVEKLHNSSGKSRLLELDPRMSQAQAIRSKCHEMMLKLFGKRYQLHLPALIQIDDQERQIAYSQLKEMRDDGVITEEEFMFQSRLLRDLPELSMKDKKQLNAKRDGAIKKAQEALNYLTGGTDTEEDPSEI